MLLSDIFGIAFFLCAFLDVREYGTLDAVEGPREFHSFKYCPFAEVDNETLR